MIPQNLVSHTVVAEKNATINILDGRNDGRTEVKQYTQTPKERGYNKWLTLVSKLAFLL